jgi:hypothetical protein
MGTTRLSRGWARTGKTGSGGSEEESRRSKKGRGHAFGQDRRGPSAPVALTPDEDGHGQETEAQEPTDEGSTGGQNVATAALAALGGALSGGDSRRRGRTAGHNTVVGRRRHAVGQAERRSCQGQHQRQGADQPGCRAPAPHTRKRYRHRCPIVRSPCAMI